MFLSQNQKTVKKKLIEGFDITKSFCFRRIIISNIMKMPLCKFFSGVTAYCKRKIEKPVFFSILMFNLFLCFNYCEKLKKILLVFSFSRLFDTVQSPRGLNSNAKVVLFKSQLIQLEILYL